MGIYVLEWLLRSSMRTVLRVLGWTLPWYGDAYTVSFECRGCWAPGLPRNFPGRLYRALWLRGFKVLDTDDTGKEPRDQSHHFRIELVAKIQQSVLRRRHVLELLWEVFHDRRRISTGVRAVANIKYLPAEWPDGPPKEVRYNRDSLVEEMDSILEAVDAELGQARGWQSG